VLEQVGGIRQRRDPGGLVERVDVRDPIDHAVDQRLTVINGDG
jgi:hypothetical protein